MSGSASPIAVERLEDVEHRSGRVDRPHAAAAGDPFPLGADVGPLPVSNGTNHGPVSPWSLSHVRAHVDRGVDVVGQPRDPLGRDESAHGERAVAKDAAAQRVGAELGSRDLDEPRIRKQIGRFGRPARRGPWPARTRRTPRGAAGRVALRCRHSATAVGGVRALDRLQPATVARQRLGCGERLRVTRSVRPCRSEVNTLLPVHEVKASLPRAGTAAGADRTAPASHEPAAPPPHEPDHHAPGPDTRPDPACR